MGLTRVERSAIITMIARPATRTGDQTGVIRDECCATAGGVVVTMSAKHCWQR